jgi:hypothetical protein
VSRGPDGRGEEQIHEERPTRSFAGFWRRTPQSTVRPVKGHVLFVRQYLNSKAEAGQQAQQSESLDESPGSPLRPLVAMPFRWNSTSSQLDRGVERDPGCLLYKGSQEFRTRLARHPQAQAVSSLA